MCVDKIGYVKTVTRKCINKIVFVLNSFPLIW